MKVEHIQKVQNNGLTVPITVVSYSDMLGAPMAASFHGWLYPDQVKYTLAMLRDADSKQEKFNG